MAGETIPNVEFANADALDQWLAANHDTSGSIWAILWKKATPEKYIDRDTLVKTALRYGWVDSLPRTLDERRSKLLLSPRKKGSAWSAVNKRYIAQLKQEQNLHPAGQAAVDAAIEDGSWSALDGAEEGDIPADLDAALDARPPARTNFEAFPKSAKRGILEWIALAKKPQTRAKRIAETAELAERNERALDWRAKKKGPR
ncbi:MAG: YdeI/OmpD-associated family protein [Pseudomonadota bacterium]